MSPQLPQMVASFSASNPDCPNVILLLSSSHAVTTVWHSAWIVNLCHSGRIKYRSNAEFFLLTYHCGHIYLSCFSFLMRKYVMIAWFCFFASVCCWVCFLVFNILKIESKFWVGGIFGGGRVVASEDLRNKAEKASNHDFQEFWGQNLEGYCTPNVNYTVKPSECVTF